MFGRATAVTASLKPISAQPHWEIAERRAVQAPSKSRSREIAPPTFPHHALHGVGAPGSATGRHGSEHHNALLLHRVWPSWGERYGALCHVRYTQIEAFPFRVAAATREEQRKSRRGVRVCVMCCRYDEARGRGVTAPGPASPPRAVDGVDPAPTPL